MDTCRERGVVLRSCTPRVVTLRQEGVGKTKPAGSIRNQLQVTSLRDKRRQHIYLVFPVRGDDSYFGGCFEREDRSPHIRQEREKLMNTSPGNSTKEGGGEGMGRG